MEILKGFSFDLQRFTALDLSGTSITVEGVGTKTFGTDTGAFSVAADGTIYADNAAVEAAAKTVVGSLTLATTNDIVTLTLSDALTDDNVTLGSASQTKVSSSVATPATVFTLDTGNTFKVAKDGAVTTVGKAITAATDNLATIGTATKFSGFTCATGKTVTANSVGVTLTGFTGTINGTSGAVSGYTAGTVSTATAEIALNGTEVTGAFTIGDSATFTAAANVSFTTTATGTLSVTSNASKNAVAKATTAGQTLEVDGAGAITLTNGEFTSTGYGLGVAVTSTGTVQIANVKYAASSTGLVTGAETVSVTKGTVELLTNNGVTTLTSGTKDFTLTAKTEGVFNSDYTVASLTKGDVQAEANADLVIGSTTYANNGSSTLKVGVSDQKQLGLMSGTIKATSGTYNVLATANGAIGDEVVVSTSKDNKGVEISNSTGNAQVKGLDEVGEKVVITDKSDSAGGAVVTLEVVSDGVVRMTDNKGSKATYWKTAADTVFTDIGGAGGNADSNAIITSKYDKTTYFNEIGIASEQETTDTVATLTVSGSSKSLTVTGLVGKGVDVTSDTVAVTDKGTETVYKLTGANTVKANKASFTVDSDGALTKASGTITVTAGTLAVANSNAAGSGVTIDVTATDTSVSYAAGTNLSKTTVNTDAGKYVITETQNKDTAAATVITKAGAITGLDTGATVTGFAKSAAATITTAGSGKFTVNDVAWTVSESDNGVTLGYDNSGVLTSVNLGKGEIVETTAKLTGKTVTVNQEAGTKVADFAFTKAQAGATFSYDGTNATAAVFTKGDVVVVGANTYTVNAVGSGKDGVIVTSAGALKGLNDGDKVTVAVTATPTADNTVYEVSGKAMIVTKTAGGTTTTAAYTLTDEAEPFGATNAVAPTLTTDITNATAGTTVAANINQVNATKPVAVTSIVDGVYVNADGTLTFSKDKAVGKITETDSLIKYDSQSSKAQEVNVTGAGSKDWYITTGDGKDQVTFADNTNVSINGGAGDDTIKASGNGDKILYVSSGKNDVSLGAGSGSAQVSLGSGNDKFSATGYTGDVVITAAGGNNNIDASGISGDVTIIGSSGNDTIKAAKADNIVKGNGGNNTFDISASSVKIADYAFGKDVIATSATGVAPTVAKADLSSDGKITSGTQTADISATAGSFYAATLVDSTGKKTTNVAWAKDGAAKIDTSSFSKDANLFGNEDGANYLVSGAGKDVIHSYGDNDTVYGGASDDSYILTTGKTGRVVGFSTNGGKDTASGFNAKFEEGDSIYMLDGSFANLKATYDGTAATLKSGSAQLVFTGSGVGTQSSGAGEFVINGKKAAVLAAGATATVGSASYADAYIGDNSAVDFSSVDSDLYVDLSNDLASSGSGAKFVGIHTVVGGAGKSTLIGSAKDDLITAGTGGTSLYGGKGKDTLVGNGDYSDMFFIGGGSGMSTITSFQTSEYDNADTVKVLGNVTAAKLTNDGIEISSDSSKGIITNLVNGSVDANAKVRIESNNFTGVAKVGSASSNNSFTFEKGVGYYGGGSGEDKLAVDSSNTENAQVWLDGSQGVAYTSVDVVDFSSGSADYILVGDSAKNTISGGNGNNSLWGGVGNSVDILESSSNGTTTFFYGFGEGNDTISSNGANDAVNLYNIKLSDVKTGEITGTGVNVEFNDGSKLAVNTTRNVKFSLASGESYIANQSTKGWDQA